MIHSQNNDWWRGAVIYQVYPRSYADSNDDGVGDIKGIISKLDYIKSLGVEAIWVSPFFPSPMKDFGYDVEDYCDIDPMFGSLTDFNTLVEEAHKRDIKLIIDLVLSHTSDQHPWFLESRSSLDNPKRDWYVWADPKEDGTAPNNWISIFGGPAWEWDGVRRQYYMHNFLTSQPDLNYHNPEVRDAIMDVVKFWLDLGVDGFRLDTVNLYYHDKELRDNPPLEPGQVMGGVDPSNPLCMQQTTMSSTRPENILFLNRLRKMLDEYGARTTVGEISMHTDQAGVMVDYTQGTDRMHMCYVFDYMTPEFSAKHIQSVAKKNIERSGDGWISWAVSNHDVVRVLSRWNLEETPQASLTVTALMSSLWGTYCMYQGEELGLCEAEIAFEDMQDPFGIRFWPKFAGRDGCRTPMPWDSSDSAGFSSEKPWLPIPQAHKNKAVSVQDDDEQSLLNQVRHYLNWRKDKTVLRTGDIEFLEEHNQLVRFIRIKDGEKLLCIFNLSNENAEHSVSNYTVQYQKNIISEDNGVINVGPWGMAFLQL